MSNKSKKGFTLIELLIAMSVISLIAVTFFTFLNFSIKTNTKNEKDIKALNIAQSEVENIREQIKNKTEEFETIEFKTTDNRRINLNADTPVYDVQLDGDSHKYNVKIDLQCDNNLYTIKVRVELENKHFSKKSTELITLVFGG